jgi:Fur family ferric uptake transcriptional regulator
VIRSAPTTEHTAVTVPAHTAPQAVADLDAALAVLRARGLRLSGARRQVLEALFCARGPLSAEEIERHTNMAGAGCDLASVYRNLETLEEAGVVRHLHVGHGPGLYLPAGDATELVVCERCGARADIDPRVTADVRAAVQHATGFSPRFDHFPLAGLCPRCQER